MKKASRAIIIKDGRILLIHRIKNNKEYYVLPGGGIEEGESPEEAVIRELKEETNLDIRINSLLWTYEENVNGEKRPGHYFLIKKFEGNLRLGSLELGRQSKNNQYSFEWILINKINNILMYPEDIKEKILERFSK
jgi:ADP-ribose pyrophosphatase YjhB (NUDIX family)